MTNEEIATLIANGTREGNGTWITLNKSNATMYVPDIVSPNESSLIYFYDSGGTNENSQGMRNQIASNNYNKIAVFLGCGDYNEEYLDIINNVANYKGVNNTVTHSMGASAGAKNALHMKIASIKKNNEQNQTAVVLECAYNGAGDGYLNITSEDIEVLKNSNSSLLFIEEWYRDDKSYDLEYRASYLSEVAKAGVPVIVAHNKSTKTFHINVVYDFSMNSNILDYLDGKSTLTGIDNYTFSYCDENGTWQHNKTFTEVVTYSGKIARNLVASYTESSEVSEDIVVPNADFSSLATNYSHLKSLTNAPDGTLFSSLIKSDENYTIYSVGEISTLIAATNFLNGINNNNYQSTTNIPKEEDYVIHKYFTVTGDLLEFISQELTNILTTANIITETDNRLAEESNSQNNIGNTNNVSNNTTTNSNNGSGTTNYTQPIQNVSNTKDQSSKNYNLNTSKNETTSNNQTPSNSSSQKDTTDSSQTITTTSTTNNSTQTSQPNISNSEEHATPNETIPSNSETTTKSDISKEETTTSNTETTTVQTNENTTPPKENISDHTTNTSNQSSSKKSGLNSLKAILGAAALGGAGYGGKKIYDKAKKAKEDEEE